MSPEYALNGLFSVKSDVFSFGVVLLEIISGKKNYESNLAMSLIGYVSVFFGHFILHYNSDFKIVSGMEIVGRKQGVGFNGPDST